MNKTGPEFGDRQNVEELSPETLTTTEEPQELSKKVEPNEFNDEIKPQEITSQVLQRPASDATDAQKVIRYPKINSSDVENKDISRIEEARGLQESVNQGSE